MNQQRVIAGATDVLLSIYQGIARNHCAAVAARSGQP